MYELLKRVSAFVVVLSAAASAQTTERVSVASGGLQGNFASGGQSITPDGRYVAFGSRSGFVPGDTNSYWDVFVNDRQTGTTELVSATVGGEPGNDDCYVAGISADGRFVVIYSLASNIVAGDTNGFYDAFVRDRVAGTTERVSVSSAGVEGNGPSYGCAMSSDGRYVLFQSGASNLVVGDTNQDYDIFLRDRVAGTTTRVSLTNPGFQVNGYCLLGSMSADARYITFSTDWQWVVSDDVDPNYDVFVRDRQAGTTEQISVPSAGGQANFDSLQSSISNDGRYVAFKSTAYNLVPGDTNNRDDIFVRDRLLQTTERVSVSTSGAQGNGDCDWPVISADGRYVAFLSRSTNFVASDANGAGHDVFLRDRLMGTTELLSISSSGIQGTLYSEFSPSLSPDARWVAFTNTSPNLVPNDTNAVADVFVRDRGAASAFTPFCLGDGSGASCPCGNSGGPGRGCQNSALTGGALLSAAGVASLSADTVQLTSSGELPTALSVVLQGTLAIAPVHFGDGLRCVGGPLKRLYVKAASGGTVVVPGPGDPTVSARSAQLGDPIALGSTRAIQVYYRDAQDSFCTAPLGSTFNSSSGLLVAWGD